MLFNGLGPDLFTFSYASSTLLTNFSASALLSQYILTLRLPNPRFSKILLAKSTCLCALKFPSLNWHSFGRHPTTITPSAPAFMLYKMCFTSTLPVHLTLIIFTDAVYFIRETPAKSAALYPHFRQANITIL